MSKKTATAKSKQENVVNINDTTTTETETTANETVTDENAVSHEIVEVEWADIKNIFEFKERVQEMETYFSNMCLQFEKNKANLMTQILYGQNDLYNMAQTLQKSKNIDQSITYELKLPTQSGEKGYFIRKEEQVQALFDFNI